MIGSNFLLLFKITFSEPKLLYGMPTMWHQDKFWEKTIQIPPHFYFRVIAIKYSPRQHGNNVTTDYKRGFKNIYSYIPPR